jgi:H+/Cl- antiporter ClcA
MLVSSQPPNTIFEFSLLFFGLAIIICGLFQRRKKVQNTSIQLISGLVISGISGFLTIRAIGKGYGEVSGLYYIAYLPLVLGILVFVMGVIQLIHHEGTNAK